MGIEQQWSMLFDPFHFERLQSALTTNGPATELAVPLREIMMQQIESFMGSYAREGTIEYDAAMVLLNEAEELAERLDGGAVTSHVSGRFFQAWTQFKADAAAYRMYHDIPAQRDSARRGGLKSSILPPAIDMYHELLKLEKVKGSMRDARRALHDRYGERASRTAINRKLKQGKMLHEMQLDN